MIEQHGADMDSGARGEMMVGRLQDHLAMAHVLVKRLKVRSNASVATRAHLASVSDAMFILLRETEALREEVAYLRGVGGGER